MYKNALIRKNNFEIYDVTSWLINKCNTHISNISRSTGSQTMKFGQLIEFNMREIFLLKNHTQNVAEKLFPDPFLKIRIECLWIYHLKFSTVCFYCMLILGLSKYSKNKETSCFYVIKSFFKKQKSGLEVVSLPQFLHGFLKKNIYLVIFY